MNVNPCPRCGQHINWVWTDNDGWLIQRNERSGWSGPRCAWCGAFLPQGTVFASTIHYGSWVETDAGDEADMDEDELPDWSGELKHQQEKLYLVARNACEGLRLFTWLSMDDETRDAFLDLARQLDHVQELYRRVRKERAG